MRARDGQAAGVKRSRVALIDESRCIGCAQCLAPCPVDAIIGAQGLMHTVVADLCIGCELCLPPCPVDCILMQPADRPWTAADAEAAKWRARRHKARLAAPSPRPTSAGAAQEGADAVPDPRALRRAEVAAALARTRARKASAP